MASKGSIISLNSPSGFAYERAGVPAEIHSQLIADLFSPKQNSSKGKVGAQNSAIEDKSVRDISAIHFQSPSRKPLEDFLQSKIDSFIQQFPWGKNRKAIPCNAWGYFKYDAPGGHYDWHCDEGHVWPNGNIVINYPCRHLTAVYYPNSNYEGGQIELGQRPYGAASQPNSVMIKPEFDHLLLFPSDIRFPHKVHPVVSGSRVSIVNWFNIG